MWIVCIIKPVYKEAGCVLCIE